MNNDECSASAVGPNLYSFTISSVYFQSCFPQLVSLNALC